MAPEMLWKYRPWNDHTRSTIEKGELFFAPPSKLNDPFEFRFRTRFPSTPAEIDMIAQRMCDAMHSNKSGEEREYFYWEIRAGLVEFQNQYDGQCLPDRVNEALGIVSLSERNDNLLMWSHYSDLHRGVCIGISPSKITGRFFHKVKYKETLPLVRFADIVDYDFEVFERMALIKSKDWSYEKEWRIGDDAGSKQFLGCVEKIILGAKADDGAKKSVTEAVVKSGQPVDIYESHLSKKEFAIDIRRVL